MYKPNVKQHPVVTASLIAVLTLGISQTVSALSFSSFSGLGDLAGGSFLSRANGVSADGSVIVGESTSASGFEAFRYTSRFKGQACVVVLLNYA